MFDPISERQSGLVCGDSPKEGEPCKDREAQPSASLVLFCKRSSPTEREEPNVSGGKKKKGAVFGVSRTKKKHRKCKHCMHISYGMSAWHQAMSRFLRTLEGGWVGALTNLSIKQSASLCLFVLLELPPSCPQPRVPSPSTEAPAVSAMADLKASRDTPSPPRAFLPSCCVCDEHEHFGSQLRHCLQSFTNSACGVYW